MTKCSFLGEVSLYEAQ